MNNYIYTKSKIVILTGMCLLVFASCKKEVVKPNTDLIQGVSGKPTDQSILLGSSTQVPDPCIQRCLVAGKNMNVGTVDVAVGAQGELYITYNINKPNIYLLETHADVFKSIVQFKADKKLSGGGAIPGKLAFSKSFTAGAKVTKYTVVVPKAYVDQNAFNGNVFIATHAALSNGESAWGGICADTPNGTSLENARQFPGANWSVYFDFALDQCQKADFTFAWEDLQNVGNDGDYNDLVVQASSAKVGDELKLNFKVVARGAFLDHSFKIKIPKAGITAVQKADGQPWPQYTDSGIDYIITVFESTKGSLPSNGAPYFQTNTFAEYDCVPFAVKDLVLKVDNSFIFNTSKPYIPFISVYASGAAPYGSYYDLQLFAFTGEGTWTASSGDVYPNGIIIPTTWKWPLEGLFIKGPYPAFPANNWASNLANALLTYDLNKCN